MRKLIIAATALAFIASPAFAQSTDKSGSTPAASDTGTMKKTTKTKKSKKSSSMKKSDDATTTTTK